MLLIGTERGIDRDTEYVLSLLYIHRRVLHPFICGIITRWAYIHGEATGKSIFLGASRMPLGISGTFNVLVATPQVTGCVHLMVLSLWTYSAPPD